MCCRFCVDFCGFVVLSAFIDWLTDAVGECRHCCEFLAMMMQLWPTQTLERHVAMLQDAIKKGVNDPDADARCLARRSVKTKHVFLYIVFFSNEFS